MASTPAPATCCVCLDDHPLNLLTRVGDNIICHDCARQMLQRAMDNEANYPPKLGSHTLDVLAYHNMGIVSNNFLLDFYQREREYRCPVNRRIFCTWPKLSTLSRPEQATIEHCNYFLAQSIEKPTDVQVNGGELVIACAECHQFSCLSCGKRIEGYEQARDHRCISLSAADAESAAFEGMQRGKHYQICPSERCGRRVELRDGCNHMSCMCGMQFCFVCGEVVSAHSNHWEQRIDGSGCPRYNQPCAPNAAFDPNMAQRAAHRATQRATLQAAQQALRNRFVNMQITGGQAFFDPGEQRHIRGHRIDRGPVFPALPAFAGPVAGQDELRAATRVARGAHPHAPQVFQARRFHGADMMANRLNEDMADMQHRLQTIRRASEERETILAAMLRAEANRVAERFDDFEGASIAAGTFAQAQAQEGLPDNFFQRRHAIPERFDGSQGPSITAGTFAHAQPQGDSFPHRRHARVFTGPAGRPVGFYGNDSIDGEDHPHPLQSNPAHGLPSPFTYGPHAPARSSVQDPLQEHRAFGQQTSVSHRLPGYARPLRSTADYQARNYSPWNQTDFRPGAPSPVLRPLGAAYASGLPNMRSSENQSMGVYNTTAHPNPGETHQIHAYHNPPPAPTAAHPQPGLFDNYAMSAPRTDSRASQLRTALQGRLSRRRQAAAARGVVHGTSAPSPPSQEERDLAEKDALQERT